jgi:tellurium resistance protein TerD
MSVNLVKGQKISLSKDGLSKVRLGLGWNPNVTDTGSDFDLDASVFMIDESGKVPAEKFFVFYNNTTSEDGAVVHHGDNRTGEGEGDDEVIEVDLSKVDERIVEILFVVTIYEAEERKQNFGQVSNSYIRIVNMENDTEFAKYELDEDFSVETAVEFGKLYKKNGEWKFQAIGTGYKSGLQAFVDKYIG